MKKNNSGVISLVGSIIGSNLIELQQNKNLFKLGRQCSQCKKVIIHRQVISVCQCYNFAHKDCLINQLQKQLITQCTVIKCGSCKYVAEVNTKFDFQFAPKIQLRDFIVMFLCLLICALTMIYLVNFKNNQKQQITKQTLLNHKEQIPLISAQQVAVLILTTLFGSGFWLTLIGIFFKRKVQIYNIVTTNMEIKVSAFESLEQRIKEESQQEILIKKQDSDL